MMPVLPTPLPRFDRWLLGIAGEVVPAPERDEWTRTWQAELWHLHDRSRNRNGVAVSDIAVGLTRDAFWLRTESWRRAYSGAAILCVASLSGLCLFSGVIGLFLSGSVHGLIASFREPLGRSLFAAPLVVFVSLATASRRPTEQNSSALKRSWLRRQMFFAVKVSQVLVLAFLLSSDACVPLFAPLPNTAELLQFFCFVVLALAGLRWALRDQEQRCKQCLHALASPARVGRPSHNLLEWNGTELNCRHGHGLLSVPEMETSWCDSSRWVELDRGWDEAASA
jgi:hypothetical protein